MKTHRKQSKARTRTVCWLIRCVRFVGDFFVFLFVNCLSISLPSYGSLWYGIEYSPLSNIPGTQCHTIHAMQNHKNSLRCWFVTKYVHWWAYLNKCMEHAQPAPARSHFFTVFLLNLSLKIMCGWADGGAEGADYECDPLNCVRGMQTR